MNIESVNTESSGFSNISEAWRTHAPKTAKSDGDTAHLSMMALNATETPVSGMSDLASSSAAAVLDAHGNLDAERALALLARLDA